MIIYKKEDIKNALTKDMIFEIFQDLGGDPEVMPFGLISSTICHNMPGEGSRKLYFYDNTHLCKCYTGCDEPIFDIFELIIKAMYIQKGLNFDLNDAIRWVAQKFGLSGTEEDYSSDFYLEDRKKLLEYERIQDIELNTNHIVLKEYDSKIIKNLNYKVKIKPWIEEGITKQVLKKNMIGFYPGGDQITIPHFDQDGRFIGLRGRTVVEEDGEKYGKYRPIKINEVLYSHPLGMNLYNLNNSKKAIKTLEKAIIFEGEKSCLKYASFFGIENDISVACCGSSISNYQIQLLIEAGAKEIIIAFDRQFKEIGDNEFKKLKRKLANIYLKYSNIVNINIIFDKDKKTDYKDSPIDKGREVFVDLYLNRIKEISMEEIISWIIN